ncbi:hypothetical protein E5S48_18830, partial [Escherichia coli]
PIRHADCRQRKLADFLCTGGIIQGPIRHADCRQRKLADFLCTGGIIQGLISVAHQAILHLSSAAVTPTVSG